MRPSDRAALIERVYDAVLDMGDWDGLMSDLVSAFNSSQAALLSQDSRSGLARVRAHTAGVSEGALRDYETYYGPRSPLFHHFKSVRLGTPYTDADYPEQEVYKHSEVYNDFYRPLNAEHLLGVDLERSGGLSTYLIVRRGSGAGFFTPAEARCFREVGKHVARALQLKRLAEDVRGTVTALEGVLACLPSPVFLADADGRIVHLNPQAERLAGTGDGLWLRQGRLRCRHPADGNALDRVIGQAGNGHICSDGGVVVVRRRKSAIPLMVEVTPLPSGLSGTAECGLVMIRVVEREARAPEPQAIAHLLGLTPAEAAVTASLCRGESIAEYAASSSISVHTARTLLRNAMAKTGTHRQAELVSLALSMVWDTARRVSNDVHLPPTTQPRYRSSSS